MCARELSKPLKLLFAKSISEGSVPKIWKDANITPIFKKRSRLQAVNYRPVSLTSIICKLLEGIIRDVFMSFLVKNGLISKDQHGFVEKKACVTNLLETLDFITSRLADGECVDVIFLDFLKAFDMVPHMRLLKKLKGYGVSGVLHDWFSSFLSKRRQRVVLGDCESTWRDVKSGVPQGSVLGPLLFVLYINDLPECVGCECKLYADDSKLISATQNGLTALKLQNDIDSVSNWTKDWLMRLNASKCKVMHLGSKNAMKEYNVEDLNTGLRKPIEETECEKDMGVFIRSDLKWEDQVRHAASKANKVLGMLKKTFVCRESELWKKLYISLVRPHLEYAVQVWNPYYEKDIEIIEKVQRRATKIPTELSNLEYEERLKRWGLTTLKERRVRGCLIQMYKVHNELETINWYRGPQYSVNPHEKRLKQGNSISLIKEYMKSAKINDFRHFVGVRYEYFTNSVVEHWNKLSNHVVTAPNLNTFKARLDAFMMNGCYSS